MNPTTLIQMLNSFWWIKNKLLNLWIKPSDLEWVDFNDPNSLNVLAAKIMPWLLKNNPQAAKQIKESWLISWQTKQEVIEAIDWL